MKHTLINELIFSAIGTLIGGGILILLFAKPPTPPTTCSEMAMVCGDADMAIQQAMNIVLSGEVSPVQP